MKFRVLYLLIALMPLCAEAQKSKDVYVDKDGVMRWGGTKEEVYGFGVNYTAPFAHAYRSGKKLQVDLEREIENDVYHFARLGFDAFRVHVWDTEISDSIGNLLENDHLKIFDFMLWKMKERGIRLFITPIAFWGNGWPEPDEKTPGFARKYGKDACLVNEEAIKAQENYLHQFLNHVNPYTKVAYKNDPDIVGFEVSNEPHHRGTKEEVQKYIDRMVASMRKTGCKKPILYNISHSIHRTDAYFASQINGGTFQWYPTGLGARHELRGNFLPNVDKYVVPFANEPGFKKMAKVVYEFDAADVGRSYIYPAMARSFREAGIQWATHFAYDPTYLAYANTEYNTHYMNLVYTPQKALSLKISSEVFHQVPRYKSFGAYPANTTFGDFRVNYEEDLAELVSKEKFFYTNSTRSQPSDPGALKEIAGAGNSPLVSYEGTGAYFLDKIGDAIWRLEVLPDAIWVDNPFGRNSLKQTLAVINWREWPMSVKLPGLGEDFTISNFNNEPRFNAKGNSFNIKPGVYLLIKNGVAAKINPEQQWKNIKLNEYVAPPSTVSKTYVLHNAPDETVVNKDLNIKARIVTKDVPQDVRVHVWSQNGRKVISMNKISGYDYTAEIPAEVMRPGYLSYFITVTENNKTLTFPAGAETSPNDWDFFATEPYKTAVVTDTAPLYLFNAISDAEEVSREWRRGSGLLPIDVSRAELVTEMDQLSRKDPENENGQVINDYAMRYNFTPKVLGRKNDLGGFTKLVIKGRSIDKALPVQVALVDKRGGAFGAVVPLNVQSGDYEIKLAELKQVQLVTLPRPYPTFLPYFFKPGTSASTFSLADAETLQVSVGPGLGSIAGPYKFAIESIRLE
jgi:hypothetical protein